MNYNVDIDDCVGTQEELMAAMYKKLSGGDQQVMQEIAMPGVDTRIKAENDG